MAGLSENYGAAAQDHPDIRLLQLESDHWGIFGPTFRTTIPVIPCGDGLYKISKSDWNETIGPIFDRMRENIVHKNTLSRDHLPIANGYLAMEGRQVQEFHTLLQSFSAAAQPEELYAYPGTPETNPHLARIAAFTEAFNGPEQSVLINGTQLQALANVARRAMEYAYEEPDTTDNARNFYGTLSERGHVSYSNGLVRALS